MVRSSRTMTVVLGSLAAPAAAEEGAPDGERLFQRCYACHSLDPAERNLPGPTLAGVVGRPAASLEFGYSPAMIRAGEAGLVWDGPTLDAFLADPETVLPGTWMSFPGMADPAERAGLIGYIAGAGAE